jgi:hypothetical protein
MSPKRLYKFGKTSFPDVLERYSVDLHLKEGWRGVPLAQDYNIKVLWSRWVTPAEAVEAEAWFKRTYPKTFSTGTTYNGITECRKWTPQQSYSFYDTLQKKFPRDQISEGASHKIYYIILTLK